MKQLPLSIPLRDHSDFDNFYVCNNNAEAVGIARRLASDADGQVLLLHGEAQSGRSHLLEAACLLAQSKQRTALYLPLRTLITAATSDLFDGLESVSLLALDDVDCLAGKPDWEEALFHLYNRGRQAQQSLLLSSRSAPFHIPFLLKDIHSRLGAALVYKLHGLDDEGKQSCLKLRAANLGLTVSDEVANYILLRSSRDLASLVATIETLDRETLSEKRRLTVPFVKKIMSW
ncbi:MAG: DnaA regulatory inactivator Hda [Pseudomonadales bacterium]